MSISIFSREVVKTHLVIIGGGSPVHGLLNYDTQLFHFVGDLRANALHNIVYDTCQKVSNVSRLGLSIQLLLDGTLGALGLGSAPIGLDQTSHCDHFTEVVGE